MTESTDPDITHLVFHEVDRKRWGDLERLFQSRGGPKNCWCMVWRTTAEERRQKGGAVRKAMLKQRVEDDVPVGILGYLNDEPVTWCAVAPRTTFLRLGGPEEPDEDPEKVWSIVCFFVSRPLRGKGVTAQLIESAVEHAKRHGATVVEAYPVDPDSPSYRFMGYISSFKAAGFHEVGRTGIRRHILRKTLAR
jgi:GNAT superfamily N-acetyltransferase